MAKKWMALALAGVMGASMLAGCGGEKKEDTAAKDETSDSGTAEAGETIKIGAIGPLTGAVSQYGIATINGVKMYIDEVNAAGGIDGKQIELLIEDEKGAEDEAVNVYEKLASDGMVALIGDVTSKPSIAVAGRAAQSGMPMISPTGTAYEITQAGDNVFRACFLDPFQSEMLATFASQDLSAKTAAILFNVSDDYSVGLKDAFVAKAAELGLEIVAEESYNQDDVDFKAQLTKIAATNPDVLLLPDYYSKAVLIAAQIKEVGLDAIMLGPDGWDGVLKATDTPEVLEGAYFCNHYAPTDEKIQPFIKNYQEAYGDDPNAFATLGYDAAQVMVAAIKAAGSTDSAAIVEALKNSSVEGLTGKITFDEDGNPIKVAHILTIKDGQYEFVKNIER